MGNGVSRAAALRRSRKKTTIRGRWKWAQWRNIFPVPSRSDGSAGPRALAGNLEGRAPARPERLSRRCSKARDGRREGDVHRRGESGRHLPPAGQAKEALEKLELLVCQELFLTETAAWHMWCCRPVPMRKRTAPSPIRKACAAGPAGDGSDRGKPAGLGNLSALSVLMGYPLEYGDAKEILKEIRSVIPGYGLLGPAPRRHARMSRP